MSQSNCFFEVPIYRCSLGDHAAALEHEQARYLGPLEALLHTEPHQYEMARRRFQADRGYPWRYNEVVGWIRLYVLGDQIRGDVWLAEEKRLTRRGPRSFRCRGKAIEIQLWPEDLSHVIFGKILSEISALRKQLLFRRRHIDVACLQQIGPFIDWRRLLGLDCSCTRPRSVDDSLPPSS